MTDEERVTMQSPVDYEVWVQGHLHPCWIPHMSIDTVCRVTEAEGGPITVLRATFRDQAELRGLLDRVYDLHLPLLAVHTIRRR